jgi:hypothetical protein
MIRQEQQSHVAILEPWGLLVYYLYRVVAQARITSEMSTGMALSRQPDGCFSEMGADESFM